MNLQEALMRLGDSPDAIARTLQDQGIRGRRFCALLCPVAWYLRRHCGFGNVSVTPSNIMWDSDLSRNIRPTPDTVVEFLLRFDRLVYPQLLTEGQQ